MSGGRRAFFAPWRTAADLSRTHGGPLIGLPPTGTSCAARRAHVPGIRDGKAGEQWATRDDLRMPIQRGVVLLPGGVS
ncbi:MAG: hypothetical protein KDC33_10085 [Thermoleophilia bacterium]|nr:hypothetical protein [Thermoleophilia bacterium]